jgi:hypothetical protein
MVAASILFFTIVMLTYLFGAYLNFLSSGRFDYFTFLYLLIAIIIPIFYMLVKLLTADVKADYHFISLFTKVVMLMGILYSVFFRLIVA